MIVDFDDHSEQYDALPWLHKLKEINPAFRCTLFAVPALGTRSFWEQTPSWCELAVHGWGHPDPYECADWPEKRLYRVMDDPIVREFFVEGFKAPGWQISDGCYEALLQRGWWVADQHLEDGRRPEGLRTYFYEDGEDRHHGHVQNVCGNGIEETWDELTRKVAAAETFEFCSAALSVGSHPVAA